MYHRSRRATLAPRSGNIADCVLYYQGPTQLQPGGAGKWQQAGPRQNEISCAFRPARGPRVGTRKNKVVLPRGLNSNRVEQLQVVIKDWVEIYKSPPQLDGKTFQWSPLLIAA